MPDCGPGQIYDPELEECVSDEIEHGMPPETGFGEWAAPSGYELATGSQSVQDWLYSYLGQAILPTLGSDYSFGSEDWENWWDEWGENVEGFAYDPADEVLSLRGTSAAYDPLRSGAESEMKTSILKSARLGFGGRGYLGDTIGDIESNLQRDVSATAYSGRTNVRDIWSEWYEDRWLGPTGMIGSLTEQGAFGPDQFGQEEEEPEFGPCYNLLNQSIPCPEGCADGSIVGVNC